MIHIRNDPEYVWKFVKNTRKSFLLENIDPPCITGIILYGSRIEKIINIVEDKLKINASVTPHENVTGETLQTAGEMFIYLTICPHKLLPFYYNLFKTSSPTQIALALTSVIKTSQNSAKEVSIQLLNKLLENSAQYQNILTITKDYKGNKTKKQKLKDDIMKRLGLTRACIYFLEFQFCSFRIQRPSKDNKSPYPHC